MPPAEVGELLDEHVTTLVSRYAGRVDAWIVVNEAIWGPDDIGGPAQYAESIWSDALGPEYIERAFHSARAADPDAVLLYNETGAEELNEKADFLYGMASDFVARGVPIDGIGFQLHVDAADPPDLASVQANFERFAALGLEIHITELDVSLAETAGDLQLQADVYRGVVETCLAVPACRDLTVFGFTDRYAWDELGDAAPLLFDEEYEAEPAYFAVQAALRVSFGGGTACGRVGWVLGVPMSAGRVFTKEDAVAMTASATLSSSWRPLRPERARHAPVAPQDEPYSWGDRDQAGTTACPERAPRSHWDALGFARR